MPDYHAEIFRLNLLYLFRNPAQLSELSVQCALKDINENLKNIVSSSFFIKKSLPTGRKKLTPETARKIQFILWDDFIWRGSY